MTMSSILVKSFQLSAIAAALTLTGCGGGNNMLNPGGSSSSDSTPAAKVNISPIELIDANGKATHFVNSAGVTAKVRVTTAKGAPISGALVTFTGEGVTFGTSNGAVVTNSDGIASISVKPTDINDTGSYQLTAATTVEGVTATSLPLSFSLQATDIEISGLKADNTALKGGDSTTISVKTLNSITKAIQGNVPVNFSATCGTFDKQTVVSSESGDASVTYKAIDSAGNLCQGTQTIIAANGNNNSINQKISLDIATVVGSSISYTTTDAIYLQTGASGNSAPKTVEFTIYSNGTPVANQQVKLDLTSAPSDASFGNFGNRNSYTVTSNSAGKVSVNLYAGQTPGPIEVKASLVSNPNAFAIARNIYVATGRLTQDGLSLSAGKYSLNGQLDGDTTSITARMVDRNGNAVPDGTVVSFVSEGGRVDPSCATKDGVCSVNFYVQNPRPADSRVTVLAYAEGEKKFKDNNNNNTYDMGVDTLVNNIGDFFRDDNEDNQYQTGEFIYKRGASGTACGTSSFAAPNLINTCDNSLEAMIRSEKVFAFAGNRPVFVGVTGTDSAFTSINSTYFKFQVFGNSEKTVPMPSGTTVEVSAQDNTTATTTSGSTTGTTDTTCTAELLSGNAKVPESLNLLTPTEFSSINNATVMYGVRLTGCQSGDDVRVTVTTPSDEKVTRNIVL